LELRKSVKSLFGGRGVGGVYANNKRLRVAKAEVAVNSNTSALSDGEGMGMGNKDSQMRHTKIKNNNGHVFLQENRSLW
jgi:hypothetical protein